MHLTHRFWVWRWSKGPGAKKWEQLLETRKGKETASDQKPLEGKQSVQQLDFNPVGSVLDLWHTELWDNKPVCSEDTKFVVICYDTNRKLTKAGHQIYWPFPLPCLICHQSHPQRVCSQTLSFPAQKFNLGLFYLHESIKMLILFSTFSTIWDTTVKAV